MKKFAYKTLCLLDLYEKTDQKMKKLFPFILILYSGCSDKPVDMDVVLFERSGQYITNDNYSDFFFFKASSKKYLIFCLPSRFSEKRITKRQARSSLTA